MSSAMQVGQKLVDLCKVGKNEEAVNTLYAENCVSVEAVAGAGFPQEMSGLADIKKKGQWWAENHEVHSAEVVGPFPHGDKFIVMFNYDVTFKPQNQRQKLNEAGLYTVANGKVVREEFFYDMSA